MSETISALLLYDIVLKDLGKRHGFCYFDLKMGKEHISVKNFSQEVVFHSVLTDEK